MSTPFSCNPAALHSLVPFDQVLLDSTVDAAHANARHRYITRFHELHEPFQRMLNAIEPQSYVRPHRHLDPDKAEVFIALQGSALVVRYDETGTPQEGVLLDADGPVRGVEIPVGAWHSLVSLESGTVLFEAKEGPYVEAKDKDMAPWAPPESDHEAAMTFIANLRAHFAHVIPQLAVRDLVEAEEDDIC
ncbi:MAG: WbuC family cupin fold metalloprotein [Chloroflexota bacterium]